MPFQKRYHPPAPSRHVAVKDGLPDEALGDEYPFKDRYVTLDDGTHMHYIEMGRAGLRRPTLLLLHGNPTWSYLYRHFMKPLSKVARVVAVDHVGFGRSDHPKDPDYYTLEQHIRNLEEFVEKVGLKRVIPVMQDWGGPIGLGYATRHPDNIAGLVVMNTWAFTERGAPELPFWFKALTRGRLGDHFIGKKNVFVEGILQRFLMAPTPEIMEAYRHPFPNQDSRAGVVQFPRMIPTGPKHLEWRTMDDIEKRLETLDVPAIILWALQDPAFGKKYAHLFHEMLPQAAEPEWFPDAGHYLQEDVPGELVPRIEAFVKGL